MGNLNNEELNNNEKKENIIEMINLNKNDDGSLDYDDPDNPKYPSQSNNNNNNNKEEECSNIYNIYGNNPTLTSTKELHNGYSNDEYFNRQEQNQFINQYNQSRYPPQYQHYGENDRSIDLIGTIPESSTQNKTGRNMPKGVKAAIIIVVVFILLCIVGTVVGIVVSNKKSEEWRKKNGFS